MRRKITSTFKVVFLLKRNFSKYINTFIIIISAITIIIFISSIMIYPFSDKNQPLAIKGLIDLRDWQFEKQGIVSLSGDWEIYPENLFDPSDFKAGNNIPGDEFIVVPGDWNNQKNNVNNLKKQGFATYRLTILVPENRRNYAIITPDIYASMKVYINGNIAASIGVVGKTANTSVPFNCQEFIHFNVNEQKAEIVIQMANYTYNKGGITVPILIGTHEQMREIHNRHISIEMFLLGSMTIIGIYYLVLFLYRKKEKGMLHFGMFCLVISTRLIFTGSMSIISLFPFIDSGVLYKIEYSLMFAAITFCILFLKNFSQLKTNRIFINITVHIAAAFCASVLVLPVNAYPVMVFLFFISTFIAAAYLIFKITVSVISKKKESFFMLLSFTPFIPIVFNKGILNSNDFVYINLLYVESIIFIFLQAFLISKRNANAFNTMEKMTLKLKTVNRLKDDFLMSISDKLRMPVKKILGISKAADHSERPVSDLSKLNFSIISVNAEKVLGYINDISDFAKIKNRDIQLDRKETDLGLLTDMALERIRPYITDDSINIVNNIIRGCFFINADEKRIEQVIYNIVDNAVKYSQCSVISIDAKDIEEMILVEISDNGIGITQKQQKNLFKAFSLNNNDLSGIGLHITRQLLNLHGGEIRLESRLNEGSKFLFTLPKAKKSIASNISDIIRPYYTNSNRLIDNIRNSVKSTSTYNILVAVNSIDTLHLITNQLSRKDYGITIEQSGEEVLAALADTRDIDFDLVILEARLLKISGYQVCREIRKQYSLFQLPVIIVTSKKSPEDVYAGFKAGANDYLSEPFEMVEMLVRIETLITLRHSARSSVINARKLEYERNQRMLVETLGEVASTLSSTLEMNELLQLILHRLRSFIPYHYGMILLYEEGAYRIVSKIDYDGRSINDNRSVNASTFVIEKAVESRRPYIIYNAAADELRELLLDEEMKSVIVAPILYNDEPLGVIILQSEESFAYNKYKEDIIFNFAAQSATALKNARLFSEVSNLAITDGLTQLYNRRHFFELAERELERYRRYNSTFTVMMLDLDDFKKLNDSYGHHTGDEVLKETALRCKEVLRENDIIGRYGGEEFVILLVETEMDEAKAVAQRLIESISLKAYHSDRGDNLYLTISIGLEEASDRSIDLILQNADRALYEAKRDGKNCFRIYSQSKQNY